MSKVPWTDFLAKRRRAICVVARIPTMPKPLLALLKNESNSSPSATVALSRALEGTLQGDWAIRTEQTSSTSIPKGYRKTKTRERRILILLALKRDVPRLERLIGTLAPQPHEGRKDHCTSSYSFEYTRELVFRFAVSAD